MHHRRIASVLLSLVFLSSFILQSHPAAAAATVDEAKPTLTARLLADINHNVSKSATISHMMEYGDSMVYVVSKDDQPAELWITDGTPQGTHALVEGMIPQTNAAWNFKPQSVVYDGVLYFQAPSAQGSNFWRSDGTPDGTKLLADILPELSGKGVGRMISNAAGVYFSSGSQLWKTDGQGLQQLTTEDGYLMLYDDPAPVNYQGKLYFSASKEGSMFTEEAGLWSVDGDSLHPQPVFAQEDTAHARLSALFEHNGLLYLKKDDLYSPYAADKNQVWASDGTVQGTQLVVSTSDWTTGILSQVILNGDDLMLVTTRSSGDLDALWRVSSTPAQEDAAPPQKVMDLSGKNFIAQGRVGDVFLFWTAEAFTDSGVLWALKDDGGYSQSGEMRILKYATSTSYRLLEDQLFFNGSDAAHGMELWVTGGTNQTTRLARDFWPGPRSGNPREMARCGQRLCLAVDDSDHGVELWSVDAAGEDAVLLSDYNQDAPSSMIYQYIPAGALTYFIADDGDHGKELWRTDGTTEGTFLLKDIFTNTDNQVEEFRQFTLVGNRMYFQAGIWEEESYQPTTGIFDLWQTEGTSESTRMISSAFPAGQGFLPAPHTAVQNQLVVSAQDEAGVQTLWLLNDQDEATALTTLASADQTFLKPVSVTTNGLFYAVGDNCIERIYGAGCTAVEIWFVAGAGAAPQQVSRSEANLFGMQTAGDQVYFAVDRNSDRVDELWRIDAETRQLTQLDLSYFPQEIFGINNMNVFGDHLVFFFNAYDHNLYYLCTVDPETNTVKTLITHDYPDWRPDGISITSNDQQLVFGGKWYSRWETVYHSDGTPEGTGSIYSEQGYIYSLTPAADRVFLIFAEKVLGSAEVRPAMWWWQPGMEQAEKVSLPESLNIYNPARLTSYRPVMSGNQEYVLFSADDGVHGEELWALDIVPGEPEPEPTQEPEPSLTPEPTTEPQPVETHYFIFLPSVLH